MHIMLVGNDLCLVQWNFRITDTMGHYKLILSTEVSLIRRLSKKTSLH